MSRMNVSRLLTVGAAAVVGLSTSSIRAQDLPTDPRVVTGVLDNGLTYKVLSHPKPPGHVALYLHVDSGSLNETDKQRGMAHYLEHMAFNGSENFPPGTVIDFFQGLGLSFGQHQNAFTSFDQTTYILDLNKNDGETLDKGFKFFSDVATKLLLTPKEIDEERQVIMNEKRTRLSGQQRVQEEIFKKIAPGSTFGERLPIGVEETIMSVQRDDFLDYYKRYYVPSNMTLMVVGDMDATAIVDHIKKNFSGGEKKPRPEDRPVGVKADVAARGIVASDKEITRASVAIQKIEPPTPPSTTEPMLRRDLVDQIAMGAFNRRLQDKVSKGEVSFQGGGGSVDNMANAIRLSGATVGGEAEKWQSMLQDMAREIVRARKFGFDQREIDDVKKEFIAGAEQSLATESSRDASRILRSMNSSVAAGEPYTSAQQDLDLFKKLLPTIKVEEVNAAFTNAFKGNLLYTLQVPQNDKVKIPTEAELVSLGETAMSADVQAEAKAARAEKLLETLPTGGKFVEQKEHAASQVWTGRLSNNALVHHRFVDYTKNEAAVTITLYGGELLETAANRGITSAAMNAWSRMATSKLSSTDIRDLMTGKKVDVRGGGGDSFIRLTVGGNPEQFEDGMQLAYLMLTDPKIEQAAFDQWKTATLLSIEQREKDVGGFMGKVVAETVYPTSDVRTQPLTKAQVEKLTLAEAQAWLTKLIAESPIEIAAVGDIQREKAMALATQYLGALPARPALDMSKFASLRKLAEPKGPKTTNTAMDTMTKLGMVSVGFYGPDEINVPETRRMQLATRMLSTRMIKKIREEEQLVYSIRAGFRPDSTFPGYGLVTSGAPCKPENADTLARRLNEMFVEFGEKGVTTEELETARKQVFTNLEEEMKKSGYWAAWTTTLAWSGRNLDDAASAHAAYEAITPEQIMETYKKYCKADKFVTIVVKGKNEDEAKPAN